MISTIARTFKTVYPVVSKRMGSGLGNQLNHRYSFQGRPRYMFSEQKKNEPGMPDPQPPRPGDQPPPDSSEENQRGSKDDPKLTTEEQGMHPSKMGTSVLIGSAVALLLTYAYMQIQIIRANKRKKQDGPAVTKVKGVGKAHIGGEWKLLNTKGEEFGSQQLKDTYYLIYFGFTHCPDICPNSLTKLSHAVANVKKSPKSSFFNLKTVFISVDPDRDSFQKIDKFTKNFDPEMIGVTGRHNNDQALRETMRLFKIYASKLEYEDAESVVKGRKSYTIDHTILTYLMNGKSEYLTHLGANLSDHEMARIILESIGEDQQQQLKHLKI